MVNARKSSLARPLLDGAAFLIVIVGFAAVAFTRKPSIGLIAVVIMKPQDKETLFVDTWFMSCRVLKRGMENFTLNTIVEVAKAKGYKRIVGEYLPTPKHKMVEQHYLGLGFTQIEGGNTAQYELNVDNYNERESYIIKK